MDWPDLAINIITYNRRDVLQGTIAHLKEHLYYVGRWHLIIADDGSDDGTQAMLAEQYPEAILIQSQRGGMGANANAGLRACVERTPYVLQLQDDMWLKGHLDLHPHVELLMINQTAGYIRLWGIGGHHYRATLEGNHWRLLWDCPELYIPSDRPHLKHQRFHSYFGMYPEGYKSAQTEVAWCFQCKDRYKQSPGDLSRPDVFVPQGVDTERGWEHMGWDTRWRDRGL